MRDRPRTRRARARGSARRARRVHRRHRRIRTLSAHARMASCTCRACGPRGRVWYYAWYSPRVASPA
eukprot:3439652-Prymnesium_polylepis.1